MKLSMVRGLSVGMGFKSFLRETAVTLRCVDDRPDGPVSERQCNAALVIGDELWRPMRPAKTEVGRAAQRACM